jgi:hypothetical protein
MFLKNSGITRHEKYAASLVQPAEGKNHFVRSRASKQRNGTNNCYKETPSCPVE